MERLPFKQPFLQTVENVFYTYIVESVLSQEGPLRFSFVPVRSYQVTSTPDWASIVSKVGDSLLHPGTIMFRQVAVFKKESGEAGETIEATFRCVERFLICVTDSLL